MTILLDNVSTDVTTPDVANIFISRGGSAIVNIRANDFGGATVEIQVKSIQDTVSRWATLASGTFTAAASVKLDYVPAGLSVRAIVTGTTGSSDGIFADILK